MQINKTDLVDQVYDSIRKQILSGALNPESPLRQEELAEQLGVSRQPISHALVLLEVSTRDLPLFIRLKWPI